MWFPQPSTLNRKIPWVCLGACWLSEVQWTAQIAWGVENSSVTGALLSAKARWSFTVAALSMWNCFFSQETQGFTPTPLAHRKKWPVAGWKQAQISLILVIPIYFHHLCTLLKVLVSFFSVLVLGVAGELKFTSKMCLDMHGKCTLGIMNELWLEQLLW